MNRGWIVAAILAAGCFTGLAIERIGQSDWSFCAVYGGLAISFALFGMVLAIDSEEAP